jgi:hypothetical protein
MLWQNAYMTLKAVFKQDWVFPVSISTDTPPHFADHYLATKAELGVRFHFKPLRDYQLSSMMHLSCPSYAKYEDDEPGIPCCDKGRGKEIGEVNPRLPLRVRC